MRRSMAPSVKRLKPVDENEEPHAATQSFSNTITCSQGVTLGGFLGVKTATFGADGGLPASTQPANSRGTQQQQQRPLQQFKCPLPYGSQAGGMSSRGSLGAKKFYSGGGADLLAALQKRVVLAEPRQDHAGSSNTVSELVLYDPEEHKLQWLAQQEAAAAAAASTEPVTADSSPQVEQAAAQSAGLLPPTAPSAPTAAAASTAVPAPPDDAKMAWDKRVKLYADPFLVEKLRPHQREGLKFVFECLAGVRQEGVSGAVLADGMGLGKTFQTIASLYCLLTKGIFGQNWGKELKHWLGDRVDPVVVDDTKADKVKKFLQDFRGFSRTGKAKVLVMSYPCFRGHKDAVYKLGIDVLMCDEAHFLKNGEAQITQAVSGLPAQRRLLMSGTPIQNDLSEFHAVFDLACPGLLGTLNSFRKTYEGPIQRGRDSDATDKQVELGMQRMNELMKICNRFMLRRTSTVLKELLPPKVEQVVFCKLSKLQLKLYDHFLQSKPVKALLASTLGEDGCGPPRKRKSSKQAAGQATQGAAAAAGGDAGEPDAAPKEEKQQLLAPLAAITALKKLCCHPDLIWDMLHKHHAAALKAQQQEQLASLRAAQQRVSARASTQAPRNYSLMAAGGDDEEEDGSGDGAKAGKKRASKKAAGSGSARQQLTGFEGCTHLFSDADVYPAYQQGRCQAFHSGKVMVLEALLKAIRAAEPTDKCVLVSNYTEALDVLAGMCAVHNWVALRLDGSCSVKQRQALVDTFNDPKHPSFVLLLSSKAGGVGLNIIGANRLVLFDPDWNPANDLQAMARVWREGQSKRVWIYRLLMAGSIEEKVLQRQLAKQGLSEALVDEVGQEVRTFSRDELRSLFKVNPNIACETHTAIKCTCDGSVEAMATCRERAAAAGGGSDDAAEQQGVLAWAHLARALDSPDPTWGAMSSWVRDNFVSYVFSDHVLDGQSSRGKPAASKKRPADPSNGSGSDADEDEDEADADDEGDSDAEGVTAKAAGRSALGSTSQPVSIQAPRAIFSKPAGSSAAAAAAAVAETACDAVDAAAHDTTPPCSSAQQTAGGASAEAAAEAPAAAAAKLPPKPRPSAKAQSQPRKPAAPAARRRSAAAPASQKADTGKGAARRRKSAPAATTAGSSTGRKKTAAEKGNKGTSGAAAAAAAPDLSSFAFKPSAAGSVEEAAGGGARDDAAAAGDMGADLCPQLSDPLDDTPMDYSSDGDFM